MTRGEKVYNTQLKVVLDPRATYTVADRRAQFELVNKIAGLLNHMSWAVDAIIAVRDTAVEKKMSDLAAAAVDRMGGPLGEPLGRQAPDASRQFPRTRLPGTGIERRQHFGLERSTEIVRI
jgi:hypothetical protein